MSSEIAIRADGISKRYLIGETQGIRRYRTLREEVSRAVSRKRAPSASERELWALQDVSFEIRNGETVGIIGRNGAGKSTMLKIIARITPPTSGRGETNGRVGSLLEVGTGFHPELTGRENIMLSAAVMGMRRSEVAARFDEIVDFSGLARFLDTPVKRYSSGMYMRLAFSVAAHLEPEILLVDEVLAVGDAQFQKKCLGRMEELSGTGRTVVFVSHSMPSVLRLCPRVILLDGGRLTADGSGSRVVEEYMGTGGGSAQREWSEIETAPGDDRVRLKSVRVVNELGESVPEIDVRDPVFVELEYWSLSEDPGFRPIPSIHFSNSDGTTLFASHANRESGERRPQGPGLRRARCMIPGNFLAEGIVFVLAAVVAYEPSAIHAIEPEAIAFHVRDSSEGDGVRGGWTGDWPGLVRPMLQWHEWADAAEPPGGPPPSSVVSDPLRGR
jgi:lipopolysaccharide transport system ATP-binding protein